MKKKFLFFVPILALIVSCADIPSISEGPRSDEYISVALNEINFINYIVQSNQKNEELGDYYTVATISPLDLSFKTKTKQLLFTTEHSSYYFDKVEDSYDIYYKDKLIHNKTYLGNSYFGRYNRTDIIEGIPTIASIFSYYHVHNLTLLDPLDFTYNTKLNGWYILHEDAYQTVLTDFFKLTNHTLVSFNLQVIDNKVRSIKYEMVDAEDTVIKNELFYTYPLDYLQDSQFSLINTISVTKAPALNPLIPSDSSSEVSSEVTSEIPSSSSETSELPQIDVVNFSIYDDAKIFGSQRHTIESIQLFENYNYTNELANTPIGELNQSAQNTHERKIVLDRTLTRGQRYLLRVNIGNTPDGDSTDYYDYSWIYS